MTQELRVLTSDVKNPTFDKRHKFGPKAVEKLKAGTVIRVVRYEGLSPDAGSLDGRIHYNEKFSQALIDASVEKEPETYTEYVKVVSTHTLKISTDVLEELWKDEAVRDKIKAAIATVNAALDE